MSHTTAPDDRGQKVKNTTQQNIEVEVSRIKKENLNIIQNLTLLEKEQIAVETTMTDQLRYWAKNYERMAECGEYKEPVSHICATICKELTQRGLWRAFSLAHKVLEPKFKQSELTPHNLPSSQVELDLNVPKVEGNENVGWQNFVYQNAPPQFQETWNPNQYEPHPRPIVPEKSVELMQDEELRDYTESLIAEQRKAREHLLEVRRREREAKEKCDLRKIPLSPEYEQDREPHVSAQSPDSGPSEAWESCLELVESYKKLADKLYRWRPPKWLAKDLKLAFDEEIEFLKPFIDEKYRKSQPAWWVVQLHNIWHGKHAAAIMNATPIDEKTKRALTREQVGDKYEEDLKRALRFAAAQKVKAKLWWWFHEMNEKGIAKRAKDLNPVLSEKSFT